MPYLFALQALCGGFCAYVAHRKGRNPYLWAAAGALIPVLGVVLCLMASETGAPSSSESTGRSRRLPRPRRCCGRFIPDCRGCPYFRRPLFREDAPPRERGYCEFYHRELLEKDRTGHPVERGRDGTSKR